MTEKSQITLYGKTYKIKTDMSSVDPQKLADYVNDKMHELSSGQTKPATIDLALLAALNVAGELFELKNAVAQEESLRKNREKESGNKARHLVQMVEKELKAIQSLRGASG